MIRLEPTQTSSDLTATERFRELLDERGVKWRGADRDVRTWFDVDGIMWFVLEHSDGNLSANAVFLTPEQAIAATLGPGTCHDVGTFKSWGLFTCSNCSVVFPLNAIREAPSVGKVLPPRFCPNCGRKVVDE